MEKTFTLLYYKCTILFAIIIIIICFKTKKKCQEWTSCPKLHHVFNSPLKLTVCYTIHCMVMWLNKGTTLVHYLVRDVWFRIREDFLGQRLAGSERSDGRVTESQNNDQSWRGLSAFRDLIGRTKQHRVERCLWLVNVTGLGKQTHLFFVSRATQWKSARAPAAVRQVSAGIVFIVLKGNVCGWNLEIIKAHQGFIWVARNAGAFCFHKQEVLKSLFVLVNDANWNNTQQNCVNYMSYTTV